MKVEGSSEEIDQLLDDIEQQFKQERTPENVSRLKLELTRVNTLLEQQREVFDKVDSILALHKSKRGELNKLVDGLEQAQGFFKQRRKVNEIVAFMRTRLMVIEKAARDGGIEHYLISETVKDNRVLLKGAEKLRESFGLLRTTSKFLKALFPATFRLLSRQRIRKPPGTRWLQFVEFFFSPKTVEGTFRPTAADWQHEHYEALKAGRYVKVRWIALRYHFAFAKTVGQTNLEGGIKWLIKLFKG
jgi:hypothetical protein